MQTLCSFCGRGLASVSTAAKHVTRHPPPSRSGKSQWGPDAYVDGERWGSYLSRTAPPDSRSNRSGEGSDSEVDGIAVLLHSELLGDETDCLCKDHYPPTPAWQMTAAGKNVGPHRHRDRDGHCVICGAETDSGFSRLIEAAA